MRHAISGHLLMVIVGVFAEAACAEPPDTIYDEAKVPAYSLPDPLLMQDGARVDDAETWSNQRRPEVLRLFEEHVHGRSPAAPEKIGFKVTSVDHNALGGRATRKQVTVFVTGDRNGPSIDLLLYLPNAVKKTVPTFLGLNFYGNQTVHSDPGIKLSQCWMRPTAAMGVVGNRATEASRGLASGRWQVEKILDRGYALATIYYGDIEPDFPAGWKLGLRTAFTSEGEPREYGPNDWGAIGVWAWGLSRAMDYLERDPSVDAKRVAVMGHSRLGKTALWAGAQDKRFAIVISNNSGEGGASLVRRRFGEALHHSVSMVPYWYRQRYRQYAWHEADLPVDAHLLIALIAPRPVYVASATKDLWADPRGEYLAAKHAEPVYRLFGRAGLGVDEMPTPDQSVGDFTGYHVRTGGHDVTAYDWDKYLDFADRHYGYQTATSDWSTKAAGSIVASGSVSPASRWDGSPTERIRSAALVMRRLQTLRGLREESSSSRLAGMRLRSTSSDALPPNLMCGRCSLYQSKIAVNSRLNGSQPFDMTFHVLFRQAFAEQHKTADDFAD